MLAVQQAAAFERGYAGFSVNPGSFLNTPATTPPPGLYGSLVFNQTGLTLKGPGAPLTLGNPTHVDVSAPVQILTYVPGWTLFGGVYSAGFAQQENYNAQSAPQNIVRAGIHNSSITPLILSWRLGERNLFVKTAVTVVVPDGTPRWRYGAGKRPAFPS